jgi:hypothetical protein
MPKEFEPEPAYAALSRLLALAARRAANIRAENAGLRLRGRKLVLPESLFDEKVKAALATAIGSGPIRASELVSVVVDGVNKSLARGYVPLTRSTAARVLSDLPGTFDYGDWTFTRLTCGRTVAWCKVAKGSKNAIR